jgi:hypothetical protein
MTKTVEERRQHIMRLVPEDARLLDSWTDQDDIVTCETKVYGDGEYACIVMESHVDDGTEDGRTALNGIVFTRGRMLQRLVQALQTAEEYTGKVQG